MQAVFNIKFFYEYRCFMFFIIYEVALELPLPAYVICIPKYWAANVSKSQNVRCIEPALNLELLTIGLWLAENGNFWYILNTQKL